MAAVRTVRVLGPVVDPVDAAGDGHGAVADDVDRYRTTSPERAARSELSSRPGDPQVDAVVGRAELAVVGGNAKL